MQKEIINEIVTIWNTPKSEALANISKILIKIILEGGKENERKDS